MHNKLINNFSKFSFIKILDDVAICPSKSIIKSSNKLCLHKSTNLEGKITNINLVMRNETQCCDEIYRLQN